MKMRVLLNVNGDYIATEVVMAKYIPFEKVLSITTNHAFYEVSLNETTGKSAMRDLVSQGFYDFSGYAAKKTFDRGVRV